MRVLLSSVGRRGYLVKYFKEALGPADEVWGIDSSHLAPGFVYCDKRYILPEVTTPRYPDELLNLCIDCKIDIIIPLIDPELDVLSKCREKFTQNNILVLVSPYQTIDLTFDKYKTRQFALQHGIASPETVLTVQEALDKINANSLHWPLIVKPRKGSASFDIFYCFDEIQLRGAFDACPEPLIQQFIEGTEYGYDLFGDDNFRPISVYCKKKLAMRAGETDKAVSTGNPVLIEFGRKILESIHLFGPADVDVIMSATGPQLIEINPRFGGGYPCSHLAGADFCKKIIAIRNGKSLAPDIGSCPDGISMLKQDEIISPDWNDAKKADSIKKWGRTSS